MSRESNRYGGDETKHDVSRLLFLLALHRELADITHNLKIPLRVRDQGVGIPKSDLTAIFEPFHRAANVAGRIPGLGIGLTNVRHTVAQHGGSIRAVSTLGQGTTITIHPPLFSAGTRPICEVGRFSAYRQDIRVVVQGDLHSGAQDR